MKCKAKGCARESRHLGKCSPEGPYAVVNTDLDVVNRTALTSGSNEGEPVVSSPESGVCSQGGRRDSSERRQTKWQRDNRERYNKRMREYMRRKRSGFIGIAHG
jgi:hypothetical protein